jgi:hypothetical protein
MGIPEEIKRVNEEARKQFGSTPGKIFGKVYAGHGCEWYVKRKGINKPNSLFFMHGDSWGQYGTDHCSKLKKFCDGYSDVETGEFLKIIKK